MVKATTKLVDALSPILRNLWPWCLPRTNNAILDFTFDCDMTDVVTSVVMRAGEIFMVTAIYPCCCKSLMLREVSPDCHQQLSLPPSTPHVTQQQQQQWLYSNIHNNINDSRDCTHVHTMYIMWSVSSHVLTICKDKWRYSSVYVSFNNIKFVLRQWAIQYL